MKFGLERKHPLGNRLASVGLLFAVGSMLSSLGFAESVEASAAVGDDVSLHATRAFNFGPGAPRLSGGAIMAAEPFGSGFWIVHADGGVFGYASAPFLGSLPGVGIQVNDIVGIAVTPDGNGYWLVGSDGGVFAFGDATFLGSMGGTPLNAPVVAVADTPDGRGYWLVASDGGVFAFGDAAFSGSMAGKTLGAPMVDMTADPAGGYWLVAADGGIFNYGGAPFMGSRAGRSLNQAIVGITSVPAGVGYWLVAADGGVFAFGKAPWSGSLVGKTPPGTSVIGLYSVEVLTGSNVFGYNLVESGGGAEAF